MIDYNGAVRACELREKFATLADYDYDFGALGGQRMSDKRNCRGSTAARHVGVRTSVSFTTLYATRVKACFTNCRRIL